jgi:hypothetical protein
LQDDSTVVLKPLNITTLRLFMKKIEEFGAAETEDDGLSVLLDSGALCLRKQKPEYWDEKKKKTVTKEDGTEEEVAAPGYTQEFEDVMDMDTLYKVLEVCGGVKLNDPNLLRAAAEAVGQTLTLPE